MDGILQRIAAFAQSFGVAWTLLLGGKTIFDVLKQHQQPAARGPFPWSLLINVLSFVIIIALLSINILLINARSNVASFIPPLSSHTPVPSVTSLRGTPLASGPMLIPPAAHCSDLCHPR